MLFAGKSMSICDKVFGVLFPLLPLYGGSKFNKLKSCRPGWFAKSPYDGFIIFGNYCD